MSNNNTNKTLLQGFKSKKKSNNINTPDERGALIATSPHEDTIDPAIMLEREDYEAEIGTLQSQVADLEALIKTLQEEKTVLMHENRGYASQIIDLKKHLAGVEEALNQTQLTMENKDAQMSSYDEVLTRIEEVFDFDTFLSLIKKSDSESAIRLQQIYVYQPWSKKPGRKRAQIRDRNSLIHTLAFIRTVIHAILKN